MIPLIVLGAYIVIALIMARVCEFHDPRSSDYVLVTVFWPLIVVALVWRVWTKQTRVTLTWRRGDKSRVIYKSKGRQ